LRDEGAGDVLDLTPVSLVYFRSPDPVQPSAADSGHGDNVYWLYSAGTVEQYNITRTPKTTQPFGNPPQPPAAAFGNSLRPTAASKLFSHEGFLYVSTLAEPGQGKILRSM
jgi:hypothetical protein